MESTAPRLSLSNLVAKYSGRWKLSTLKHYSIFFLKYLRRYFRYVLSVIYLLVLLLSLDSFLFRGQDVNRDELIFMRLHFVKLEEMKSKSRYGFKYDLRVYRESPKMIATGYPVIFLPGQGGSYTQSKSIASELYRLTGERKLDVFSIHCNEELTALHGSTAMAQAEYFIDSIKYIQSLYVDKMGYAPPVIAIGHSMGGVVIQIALSMKTLPENSIGSIIFLSSPLLAPPAPFQNILSDIYLQITTFWRKQTCCKSPSPLKNILILSLAAGNRDTIVNSELCNVESIVPSTNAVFLFSSSVPFAWTTNDHNSIIWSFGFVHALASAILDTLDLSGKFPVLKSVKAGLEVYKKRLGSQFLYNFAFISPKFPIISYSPLLISSNEVQTVKQSFYYTTFKDLTPNSIQIAQIDLKSKGNTVSILSSFKFSDRFEFYVTRKITDSKYEIIKNVQESYKPIYHIPYASIKVVASGRATVKNTFLTMWRLNLDLFPNADTLLIFTSVEKLRESSKFGLREAKENSFLDEDYYEKDHFMGFYDQKSKAHLLEERNNLGFLFCAVESKIKNTVIFTQTTAELVFNSISFEIPKSKTIIITEVFFPNIGDNLSSFYVEIQPIKPDIEGFNPVVRAFSASVREEKFYSNEYSFVLSFHGKYTGTASYENHQPGNVVLPERFGLRNPRQGFVLDFWLNPLNSYKISVKVNYLGMLGQICRRYGIGFVSFPFAIIMLSVSRSAKSYFQTGRFQSIQNSLSIEMKNSHFNVGLVFLVSMVRYFVFSEYKLDSCSDELIGNEAAMGRLLAFFIRLNDRIFFGHEHFLVVPFLFAIGYGTCLLIHVFLSLWIGIFSVFTFLVSKEKSVQALNSKYAGYVVLFIACFGFPYQYSHLMIFVYQFISILRTKGRIKFKKIEIKAAQSAEASSIHSGEFIEEEKRELLQLYNLYHYQYALWILLVIPLLLHVSTLLVWIRNLMVGWWSFTDYDGISVLPFALVVAFSKNEMIPTLSPAKSCRFIHFMFTVLAVYSILYANLYTFVVYDATRLIFIVLLMYFFVFKLFIKESKD